jgi:hypothetical protein
MWNRVVDLHSLVLGWFDDRDLFHKIGYLVAAERSSFLELVGLAQGSTKTGFDTALNGLIRDSLKLSRSGVESLTYQPSTKTERALLLMNVETARRRTQSSMRYSFNAQAQRRWSLEHIHAQDSQGLSTVEQWTAWLRGTNGARSLTSPKNCRADRPDRQGVPTISSETLSRSTGRLRGCSPPGDDGNRPTRCQRPREVDAIPTWRCWLRRQTQR